MRSIRCVAVGGVETRRTSIIDCEQQYDRFQCRIETKQHVMSSWNSFSCFHLLKNSLLSGSNAMNVDQSGTLQRTRSRYLARSASILAQGADSNKTSNNESVANFKSLFRVRCCWYVWRQWRRWYRWRWQQWSNWSINGLKTHNYCNELITISFSVGLRCCSRSTSRVLREKESHVL